MRPVEAREEIGGGGGCFVCCPLNSVIYDTDFFLLYHCQNQTRKKIIPAPLGKNALMSLDKEGESVCLS